MGMEFRLVRLSLFLSLSRTLFLFAYQNSLVRSSRPARILTKNVFHSPVKRDSYEYVLNTYRRVISEYILHMSREYICIQTQNKAIESTRMYLFIYIKMYTYAKMHTYIYLHVWHEIYRRDWSSAGQRILTKHLPCQWLCVSDIVSYAKPNDL